MQYKTLYRKYRPNNFDEVVGQLIPTKILKNSVIYNKISHAYLFYGVRGTGKTSLAKIFARSINCLDNKNGNPCEKCENCKITNANNSIDIIEIDAASNNGVDEIREIKENVRFLPTVLKYKVYIIDEVHMLSDQAFNALLKTLEEPPEHVVFILATTEYNKLPKTIISRCQVIEFKKINEEEMITKLRNIAKKEKIKIDEDSLRKIAYFSNGGLRDAIGFLEKADSYEGDNITLDTISEMFNTVTDKEIGQILNLINENNPQKLLDKLSVYFSNNVEPMFLANSILNYLRKKILTDKGFDNDLYNKIIIIDELIKKLKTTDHPKIIFEITLLSMINNNAQESDNKLDLDHDFGERKKDLEKTIFIKEENEIEKSDLTDDLKNIRVCNTLCEPDKKIITNIRKNWSNIKKLEDGDDNLLNILYYDVMPVAASDKYVVIMSKDLGTANKINGNIKYIEQMYYKTFSNKHKLICVSEKEWDIYKNKYEKDRDSFVYIDENKIKKGKDTLSNKMDKLLGKKEKGE